MNADTSTAAGARPLHDAHTHFIPADVMSWLRDNQSAVNARWERKAGAAFEFLTVNGKWGFELKDSFLDERLYRREMAAAGVAHALASPIPQLFLYEFPADVTAEIANVYNRALAGWVKEHPATLSALATVPINDPPRAARELRDAMANGLRGAILGPGLPGRMLSGEFFAPLWEEADRQRAIIFVHPLLCEDPRLKARMMPNLIGVPWETTVCATDLLLSGFLDRYPGIRVLLAHGGGFLPYQIGRLDKGYDKWTAVSASLQARPGDYLKRFWFDTVVWNPAALAYLVAVAGADRVVPGSDFPFDLSAWPPAAVDDCGFAALMAP